MISLDDCEVKEEYREGKTYQCSLWHRGERVADAVLSMNHEERVNGHVYQGAYLNRLHVEEQHRGNGLAGSVLEIVLSFAKENNLGIVSDAFPLNEDGLDTGQLCGFYRRRGFKKIGDISFWFEG